MGTFRTRSQMPRSTWQHTLNSRRFKDTVLLVSVLTLVCLSLYHATTLRTVSSQRTLRAKVLSRSYINTRAAELARKAAAGERAQKLQMVDQVLLDGNSRSTHRVVVSSAQDTQADAVSLQPQQKHTTGAVETLTDIAAAQRLAQQQQGQAQSEVHDRESQEAQDARRDQATAVAAAAASSRAAVNDLTAGADAGIAVTVATGSSTSAVKAQLVTSAFADLIPEATPGQPYSSAKGGTSTSSSSSTQSATMLSSGTAGQGAGNVASGTSKVPDPTKLPHLPADFNWKVYLLYHPDLAARGINTQAKAAEHWLQYGQYEGRVYNRLSVLMRYTACGGLTNQLYSHIAALTLAATLGAEVVLPPALTRSSFGHYFSMFKERNQVTWSAVPLDSLIDVDSYIGYWRERGIMLHKTPPLVAFPDMATPEVAYMQYDMPGINPKFVTQMADVYQQRLLLSQLVERARSAVVGHAETLTRLDPTQPVNYIVLDLPCTFFMLAHLSEMDLPKEAARSLHFPPSIVDLGEKVTAGIASGTSSPDGSYNGIHLRLESDSRDWSEILGGRDAFWQNYVNAIQQAGFDATLPLYAATGLLSYGAEDEMTTTLQKLTDNGWASNVVYKELYLTAEDQEGLSSEQKALVDFVVLTRGHRVVGLGSSTFSYYLREYRALNGYSKDDTVLADASRIGTDDLFVECGMLSHG